MTVQTFHPGQVTLHLTEAANQQALREIQRAGATGIRLDLDESGCSGFMYTPWTSWKAPKTATSCSKSTA